MLSLSRVAVFCPPPPLSPFFFVGKMPASLARLCGDIERALFPEKSTHKDATNRTRLLLERPLRQLRKSLRISSITHSRHQSPLCEAEGLNEIHRTASQISSDVCVSRHAKHRCIVKRNFSDARKVANPSIFILACNRASESRNVFGGRLAKVIRGSF